VLGDPRPVEGETAPTQAPAVTLRYTLTKQAWQIMSAAPYGATAAVFPRERGILSVLRNALDQLDRRDIQLTSFGDDVADVGAWPQTCRVQIQNRELSRHVTLKREIELPVIAPHVVFNLLRRLDLFDDVTHQAIREYICNAAPVPADLEILLDAAIEAKSCFYRISSLCGQVAVELNDHNTVIDIAGPVEIYLRGTCRADILGRSIREVLPELAPLVAHRSGIDQHISINGQPSVLRVSLLGQRPKRTLVILTPSAMSQCASGATRTQRAPGASHCITDIIGCSAAIEKARRLAARAGETDLSVLIIGESGTGKELFAHAMHNLSPRAMGPFLPFNCAAIPESLTETELFGYEDGAFTGASRKGRASLFERASGGTLFLDELADLSLRAQAALLRVVEEGRVTRVGSNRAISVDVRVISAVNKPLEDLVTECAFRRDLYHRLCGFPLRIPPLRERRQDIPLLAHHFLKLLGDTRSLPGEVMYYLLRYPWPGNVRELQQCLKYMVAVSDDELTVADLPPHIQPYVQINNTDREQNSPVLKSTLPNLDGLLAEPRCGFSSLREEGSSVILALIEDATHMGAGVGRRALRDKVHQKGLVLTERVIRKRLCALRADGLIEWGIGRTGVRLTDLGRSIRRQVDAFIGVPVPYP
jgi:transcriptional regulator with PAS, ATPase and Fis domain